MKAKNARPSGPARRTAIILVLLALGAAVWGQASVDKLPTGLEKELLSLGWTGEQVRALGGQGADWSRFRARDAALLAKALRYALNQDGAIGTMEQAAVATQICALVREMESLGYGEIPIARAVFEGVRASVGEMAAWRADGGDGGELQQRIRNRLRHEMRVETAEQIKARVRDRTPGRTGPGAEGPMIGPGPVRAPVRS